MSDDIPRYGSGVRGLFKFDHDKKELVPIEKAARIRVEAPMIQTDEIPPTESMATADREIFTSKSKLKEHYKSLGYEITGGDHLGQKPESEAERKERHRREVREDVAKTLNDLKYGNIPLTDKEKAIAEEEQRQWKAYLKRQKTMWA